MNNPPDFSELPSRSFEVSSGVIICVCCLGLCLGLAAHRQMPRSHFAPQWGALESDRLADRIADWAAQLPMGEAQREGIIGYAIA
jgi:hypothetical protein